MTGLGGLFFAMVLVAFALIIGATIAGGNDDNDA